MPAHRRSMSRAAAALLIAGATALLATQAHARLIPPAGPWPPSASTFGHVSVWLGHHHRTTLTRPVGSRVFLHGYVTEDTGDGDILVAGAAVAVIGQSVYGGNWATITSTVTDRHGAFRTTLGPITSHVRLAVVSRGPVYSSRVLVRARPRLWLNRPHRYGGVYRFQGRVTGGTIPAEGLLVALQVRNSQGTWLTVRLGRTRPTGAFTMHRRVPRGLYLVRVAVPSQAGWPLYAAHSRTRRIR